MTHQSSSEDDSEYDPIEHFARAIWLDSYSKENLLGMFAHGLFRCQLRRREKVYHRCLSWLATLEQWENFVIDWRLLLASYNLPYFHMNEFAHSEGPFKSWRGLEYQREKFLGLAADIIGRNVLYGFACLARQTHFRCRKCRLRVLRKLRRLLLTSLKKLYRRLQPVGT